jgi:lysozyme
MPNGNTPSNPPPSTSLGSPRKPMSLSPQGLAFIKRQEGYSSALYEDVAGNPTIGYGHLIKPGEDFSPGITPEQASQLLAQDTQAAVNAVNHQVKVNMTQAQFDALVDFTFNLGADSLRKSILLQNLNSQRPVVLQNFTDWNHAGGKVVAGLTRRRADEFNLFSKGEYGS